MQKETLHVNGHSFSQLLSRTCPNLIILKQPTNMYPSSHATRTQTFNAVSSHHSLQTLHISCAHPHSNFLTAHASDHWVVCLDTDGMLSRSGAHKRQRQAPRESGHEISCIYTNTSPNRTQGSNQQLCSW